MNRRIKFSVEHEVFPRDACIYRKHPCDGSITWARLSRAAGVKEAKPRDVSIIDSMATQRHRPCWSVFAACTRIQCWVTGSPRMIAAVVIGFLNATLGSRSLRSITIPVCCSLTFGMFLLGHQRRNDPFWLQGSFIGFDVTGWIPAFSGIGVLSVLGMIIRAVAKE